MPLTDLVQVRFIAADEVNGSLVEAAVDDVHMEMAFPDLTDVVDDGAPAHLWLGGNYPNPFNPRTSIRFSLPRKAEVDLSIFDVTGRRVVTLVQGILDAGPHERVWHGLDGNGRRR